MLRLAHNLFLYQKEVEADYEDLMISDYREDLSDDSDDSVEIKIDIDIYEEAINDLALEYEILGIDQFGSVNIEAFTEDAMDLLLEFPIVERLNYLERLYEMLSDNLDEYRESPEHIGFDKYIEKYGVA